MPESSGTGNEQGTSTSATAAGQQAEGAGGATTGASAGSAERDQKLSAEAAKWRVKYRETETKLEAVTQRLTELEAKATERPASPGGNSEAEAATLKRELQELRTRFAAQEDRARKAEEASHREKVDNALLKVASDAKLLDAENAVIVLKARGNPRISKDGAPVFVIREDGEEREIAINAETVKQHKLVPELFFPSEGAAGTGSRGGSRTAAAGGVDMERAKRDPNYYQANRAAIIAQLRAQR